MMESYQLPTAFPVQTGINPVEIRQSILFVCASNAALSQLGAAVLRYFDPEGSRFEIYSARYGPAYSTGLHPLTAAMIEELGQDSTRVQPGNLSYFANCYFDYIFVVGNEANDDYQNGSLKLPGARRVIKWPFPDPAAVAPYMQQHSFQNTGASMYQLIRSLLKLPTFARPDRGNIAS